LANNEANATVIDPRAHSLDRLKRAVSERLCAAALNGAVQRAWRKQECRHIVSQTHISTSI
jgi:hypothetical protein